MSEDFQSFQTNIIPAITEVRLYKSTIQHVIEHHEEFLVLPSIIQAVGDTVVNPTRVAQREKDVFVYTNGNTTNRSGKPLQVPVKIVQGTSARVRSFYYASTTISDTVIWGGSDD